MYVFIDQTFVTTKRWLQFNIEPFEDVLMKWRETVEYRWTFLK